MTHENFSKRYQFDTQNQKALLGTGGFASVYKAFDTVQKRYVAVKVAEVKHEKFNLQTEKQLVDELDSHENIVRYGNCYRFQLMPSQHDFAILKYYEEGNLNDVINKYALTIGQKHQILAGILKGVAHLHNHHIIHRDLKPQNILMEWAENRWIPKLTDFGLSKLADTNEGAVENSAIGLSIAYAAPEQIQNCDIRSNVDLWAVGVCAYQLFVEDLPFEVSRTMSQESWNLEISKRIVEGKISHKINTIPEPYRTLIKKCLIASNTKRVQKAEELLLLLEQAAIQNLIGSEQLVLKEKTIVFGTPTVTEQKITNPILQALRIMIGLVIMMILGLTSVAKQIWAYFSGKLGDVKSLDKSKISWGMNTASNYSRR